MHKHNLLVKSSFLQKKKEEEKKSQVSPVYFNLITSLLKLDLFVTNHSSEE